MSENRDYTTVTISNDLACKIDLALKKGGYLNRGDFVREAIRSLLTEQQKTEA
jgi:metal-responsive CopG/Arc/MetJ family transcriptional regulator